MSRLSNARVLVVGLGASGAAASEVLTELGAEVRGIDTRSEVVAALADRLPGTARLEAVADETVLAREVGEDSARLVVVSPGLKATSPLLRHGGRSDQEFISEVELAWRLQASGELPSARWLTLTGTNGKTTTVGMLSAMLRAAGLRAPAAGNVGTPLIRAVAEYGADVLAVELSSFQLHLTSSLAPEASACLNLAPDHLDWHGSLAAYRSDKAKVYSGTRRACIYNAHDPATREMVAGADVAASARAIGTRLTAPAVGELGVVDDVLCDRAFGTTRGREAVALATRDDLAHLAPGGVGQHLWADALAAAALARAFGIEPSAVSRGLRDFRSDAHRGQLVHERDGVRWVDDSKATNPHAAAASLSAIEPGHAVWIAGGLTKGATFDDLITQVRHRLRAVVLIGLDQEPLAGALARHAPQIPVVAVTPGENGRVMPQAVAAAQRLAQSGDSVVLAPACASWDQFPSYIVRGEQFAAATRELP